jgi:signal transduction histidine kinase
MTFEKNHKIAILAASIALTLAIHYGWVLEGIFGHTGWVHAIHGRFCYIPIAMAAAWFGLRGSLLAATVISVLVLPYIFVVKLHSVDLSGELVEIIFYYAIAVLAGALFDRELRIRKKQENTQLQLERSQKLSLVGRMAAGVAHEIKNPLASIKGAVEIMTDPSVSATDKKEFTEIASKEIKRVDGTIKEFLDFARPKELNFEKVDMHDLVNAGVRQMESQLAKSAIIIESDIQEDVFAYGDREKIHQVFLNLVLNAAEASGSGKSIHLTLKRTVEHRVQVTVRDNGPGMDKVHSERMFEPFYTTKSSGTGLGMAIVKAIVEKHNGRIHVNSEPGHGTEVVVELPEYKES